MMEVDYEKLLGLISEKMLVDGKDYASTRDPQYLIRFHEMLLVMQLVHRSLKHSSEAEAGNPGKEPGEE